MQKETPQQFPQGEVFTVTEELPKKIVFKDFVPPEKSPGFIPGGSYQEGIYPALDRELQSLREDGLLPKKLSEDTYNE